MVEAAAAALPDNPSIRDFIQWGAERLDEADVYFGHGTDNALDESYALVIPTLDLGFDMPETALDNPVTSSQKEQLLRAFQTRIEKRVPVPYITGEAWFFGMPFYVDERVLIPRSPIAELIHNRFRPWISGQGPNRVLDLCCGGGCIAIACAAVFEQAQVDAADISADALVVAAHNVERHGLGDRVRLIQSDVFDALGASRYDLIVSNPPYVGAEEMAGLPAEYACEPTLGLASGDSGLDIVNRMLRQAADFLQPNGILIIEVGNSAQRLAEMFPKVPFMWLDFEFGGEGVFLLTAQQVKELGAEFNSVP